MGGREMVYLLGGFVVFIIMITAIFGGFTAIYGEGEKASEIIGYCITAIIFYAIVMALIESGQWGNSGIIANVPFVEQLDSYGKLTTYLLNEPGKFALDFARLVTLTVLINWISNWLPVGSGGGFAGKILVKVIFVLVAFIAYILLITYIQNMTLFKWAVYCVECIITGGSIVYTPAMVVAYITGIKQGNPAMVYVLSQFPKTSLGRAISAGTTASISFLIYLALVETQVGSIRGALENGKMILNYIGPSIVLVIAIYCMIRWCIKSLFK